MMMSLKFTKNKLVAISHNGINIFKGAACDDSLMEGKEKKVSHFFFKEKISNVSLIIVIHMHIPRFWFPSLFFFFSLHTAE